LHYNFTWCISSSFLMQRSSLNLLFRPSPSLLLNIEAPKQKCKNNFDVSAIYVTVVLPPWRRLALSASQPDANKVTLGATSARAHATAHSPRSALHHLQGKTIGLRAKCSINTLAGSALVCVAVESTICSIRPITLHLEFHAAYAANTNLG
jgi:hypothetical protein